MTLACEVVPFPSARRVSFIRKQARLLAHYNPDAAERTLAVQFNARRRRVGMDAEEAESKSSTRSRRNKAEQPMTWRTTRTCP